MELLCRLCCCIPNEPVEISTCRHYMCRSCILDNGMGLVCCGTTIKPAHLNVPPPLVLKLYNSLLITCKCGEVIELIHFQQHFISQCSEIQVPAPSTITIDYMLQTQGSTSQMHTQTMGLLVDKLLPQNGPLTYRSNSGKVLYS